MKWKRHWKTVITSAFTLLALGAAWNFAVRGEGRVIAANLTSRAHRAQLDPRANGTADLTLQLDPVIKGLVITLAAVIGQAQNRLQARVARAQEAAASR